MKQSKFVKHLQHQNNTGNGGNGKTEIPDKFKGEKRKRGKIVECQTG